DVARAHPVLARHLQNPGQRHLSVAKHVWRYLYGARRLTIKANQHMAETPSCVWEKSIF
ncbi:hypothetical protein GQ44DRAFT_557314, partial [Phaeosphaeriaceae sp. PMI808]